MKIAIISDTHFGFKENDDELWADCYINAWQALEYALNNADLILMPGDIFDLEIPTQETMERVFRLFKNLVGVQDLVPEGFEPTITKIPIVVIPGTHEYRGKGYKGPLDVLESAGYIYKLSNSKIVFKKGNERVVIFGMKGVPEKVAKDVLLKLNFEPDPNAVNILMLHQSFKELLPFEDEMVASLSFNDLPGGFDLYINGHIHLHNIFNLEKGPFVLPGSTVLTQIKRNEVEKPKGFVMYDTQSKELKFIEIPVQRKYFLKEVILNEDDKVSAYQKINEAIDIDHEPSKYEIFGKTIELKPVLKIKIKGTMKAGYKSSDINPKDFERFDLIVILDRDIEFKELEEKIKNLNLEKEREQALFQSLDIFKKNLKAAGFKESFNIDEMVSYLKEKDLNKARALLERRL